MDTITTIILAIHLSLIKNVCYYFINIVLMVRGGNRGRNSTRWRKRKKNIERRIKYHLNRDRIDISDINLIVSYTISNHSNV